MLNIIIKDYNQVKCNYVERQLKPATSDTLILSVCHYHTLQNVGWGKYLASVIAYIINQLEQLSCMEMKKAWVYGIDVQPLELEFLNGVTQIFFVIDVLSFTFKYTRQQFCQLPPKV